MNELIEITKYLLPLIVLLIAVLLILNHFAKSEKTKLRYELIKSSNKIITPVRLQAYERIILFLERIRPDTMALRITKPKMSAKQIQREMLKSIREEFSHNLSQQLYVSDETWSAAVYAKEQVTRLVNLAGTKIEKDANSQAYTAVLIEMYNDIENKPVETAIKTVKKEAVNFFGI